MNGWLSLVLVSAHGLLSICSNYLCLDTGAQPLVSEDRKLILAVNGEIYNHIALRKEFGNDVKFKTHSDCEVILPLVSIIHCIELIRNSIKFLVRAVR